jgi:hypothetical protein
MIKQMFPVTKERAQEIMKSMGAPGSQLRAETIAASKEDLREMLDDACFAGVMEEIFGLSPKALVLVAEIANKSLENFDDILLLAQSNLGEMEIMHEQMRCIGVDTETPEFASLLRVEARRLAMSDEEFQRMLGDSIMRIKGQSKPESASSLH